MALPLRARYPDRPLVEEEAAPRPVKMPQRFVEPDLALGRAPLRRIALGEPGPGQSFRNVQVPSRNLWWVRYISFRLLTDATAAGRVPHIRFVDATGTVATMRHQWVPSQSHPAGIAVDYVGPFEIGGGYDIDASRQLIGLPFLMLPSEIITFATSSIQVGDLYSLGFLSVEQLPLPEGMA